MLPRSTPHRLSTIALAAVLLTSCSAAEDADGPVPQAAAHGTTSESDGPEDAAGYDDHTTGDPTDDPADPTDGVDPAGPLATVDGLDPWRDGSAAVGPACEVMAALRTQVTDFVPTDDPAVFAELAATRADHLEDLAPHLDALGTPRDTTRARLVEQGAAFHRLMAEQMRRLATDGRLDPAAFETVDADREWWDTIWFDLITWEARTCEDVPGVTRSEINGVNTLHIDLGAPAEDGSGG